MSDTLQRTSVSRRAHDVRRADIVDARHAKPKSSLLPASVEQPPTGTSRDALIASLSYSAQAAAEYTTDLWQRAWLYADVMRERGNQYLEHLEQVVPHVLSFAYEPVLLGPSLARPVNYGLVRIIPPKDIATDPRKRPFVVVDPRAGHGPGIGGFKADSEIGVALSAGHPCYFVGFTPKPLPGQTLDDVLHAMVAFLERVIELHPDSLGKPAVIGNCQAGWQTLMTAAIRPELFGPIIVAGAPVSYWAGWSGKNPMRYSGGLLGGSWLTALASDLGGGKFDGAWLVQNFENLNPANTLWTKQYNLFSKIDTERERYLGFERYWGGHVYLNDVEIQYIVDNLFIGNKLSAAELVTSDGLRIDLRNIRSPILIFCSYGDNITPPPQALGWVTDLYRDDADILAHDQTIIYALHDSIGHLGIFVSGSVGRKEHREFEANIDFLDSLPAGLYQAELVEKGPETLNPDLALGDYILRLSTRQLVDVRQIVAPDPESDRRFAAVARISEVNRSLYQSFVQPWIRAAVTPQTAEMMQRLHPLRASYLLSSNQTPWAGLVASEARRARKNRKPVAADNPFLRAQEALSQSIQWSLDQWRDWRDNACEQAFNAIYGSPWVQALAGMNARAAMEPRGHAGDTPEHRAFLAAEAERLHNQMTEGGLMEAGLRALYYIGGSKGWVDERGFNFLRRLRDEHGLDQEAVSFGHFKHAVREQAGIMRRDSAAAIAALPALLARIDANDLAKFGDTVEHLLTIGGPLEAAAQERLREIRSMVDDALHATASTPEAGPRGGRSQRAPRRTTAPSAGP
jgi:pimeloyl-ACP methyl ester carboxylesterase